MSIVKDYTALFSRFTWNQGDNEWPTPNPTILTYSFSSRIRLDLRPESTDDPSYFRPLTQIERAMYREALDAWSSVSGVIFLEASPGYGDFEVGVYDLISGLGGYATTPYQQYYMGENGPDLFSYVPDSSSRGVYLDKDRGLNTHVMLHEIGHALGLKHPFDVEAKFPTLDPSIDNSSYTVMSYNGASPKLGPLDIAAVQAIYGMPSTKGSHVSSWSWDGTSNTLHQVALAGQDIVLGTAANDIIDARLGGSLINTRGGDDIVFTNGTDLKISTGDGFDVVSVSFRMTDVDQRLANGEHRYFWTNDGGKVLVFGAERIQFTDGTLAFDFDGVAGQAYRIYQAAFARTPDPEGLSFWVNAMDDGTSLQDVAAGFLGSTEFMEAYGAAPTIEDYVGRLYENILGRSAEPDGYLFWVGELHDGLSYAQALELISESHENVLGVQASINDGIWIV